MTSTVIDDFLSNSYYDEIAKILLGSDFPWCYFPNLTDENQPHHGDFMEFGFSHSFVHSQHGWQDSNWQCHFIKGALYSMMDAAGGKSVIRARADMSTHTAIPFKHLVHFDFSTPNRAAILYVGESDGDTVIYNEKADEGGKVPQVLTVQEIIRSKPNRLVIFDGTYLHTGFSPTNSKIRVLINANFSLAVPE